MNRQIEERTEIIHDFFIKIGYNQDSSKSPKWLLGQNIFSYLFFSLFLFLVIFISFCSVIHWIPVYEKWSKVGMLVSLTFMSMFNTRLPIIGYSLFKHFKKIKENKLEFDSDLNVELKSFLSRIRERRFKPYYIGIPVLVIAITGLIQQLSIYLFSRPEFIHSVWDLFPFPVFLFSICLFWYINQQIWWIRKNIKAVELSGKK
jgi:hypothetical protein